MQVDPAALARYMGLPYTYTLLPDPDGGPGYFIQVNELPGCFSQGDSAAEASTRIREAMEAWLTVAIAHGDKIPEPGSASVADEYSGKFNVRVPRTVHKHLAEAAKREGVSLNLYVATALARSVAGR